jgi:hypothetical protein
MQVDYKHGYDDDEEQQFFNWLETKHSSQESSCSTAPSTFLTATFSDCFEGTLFIVFPPDRITGKHLTINRPARRPLVY